MVLVGFVEPLPTCFYPKPQLLSAGLFVLEAVLFLVCSLPETLKIFLVTAGFWKGEFPFYGLIIQVVPAQSCDYSLAGWYSSHLNDLPSTLHSFPFRNSKTAYPPSVL